VTKEAGPGEPPQALLQAIKRLLRPLLKAFIAHGLTLPALTQLLKELYVEVAEADFPLPGRPQTDSRINLLTGVHRKDIRVLRGRGPTPDLPPAAISRNAQMIALWAGAPDYRDASGEPLPLPKSGMAPSFESLAHSVSKDIRARVVLDEWTRLGIVHTGNDGLIHLNSAAFVPREDFANIAYYFGRNLRDHIAASAHNLSGNQPPMLERAVYYDGLTPQSAAELAARGREIGQKALIEVNKKAFELSKKDAGAASTTHRISFGVYFFSAGPDDGSKDSGG
jgi:hypothetical protein